ncbi:Rossmann-like and DUF2520 domain-containing protein [Hymenobacter sp. DG25A]|uniref:Rossmann-like and DUF2520 domain-containing protein n=1 Tax=Hymenobacter sp. DG25A TaxID=1385663 RepID=UPI0006BCE2DC|nr:Rossmann-like and DUF2520 domain-containing protein [Hymenobacter sp. DG25A]ALD21788.1 hypothetical protein AM218_11925 [Hymenobacter sp. DG25A]
MTSISDFERRVLVIGAGKVAAQLVPALAQAGWELAGVWSRTPAHAAAVAATVPGTPALSSLDFTLLPPAAVYLLAVPDAAIPVVLQQARFPAGSVVAHTSGTVPLAVFAAYPSLRGGVLYPLQTFSPGRSINWAHVPLCIEAAEPAAEALLLALGRSLSPQRTQLVATPQRQAIHIAAVFACNFTNHLLGISHQLLAEAGLPLLLLEPLVRETMDKALSHAPFSVQTGPAIRHDEPTLAAHRAALAAHPAWQELYAQLTRDIQRQHPQGPGISNAQL